MPILTTVQKLNRLRPLLEHAIKQQDKASRDADFLVWFSNTYSVLSKVFGPNSVEASSISNLPFKYSRSGGIRGVDYTVADREKSEARFRLDVQLSIGILKNFISELELEVEESEQIHTASVPTSLLTHLHPTMQQVAGKLFADGHSAEAIHKGCTALEKEVQARIQRPDLAGKQLMDAAFTPNSWRIRLSHEPNEQLGFMNLYQGSIQALRNHYAHNLTQVSDPNRAMEWMSFLSALFYKLDDTVPAP